MIWGKNFSIQNSAKLFKILEQFDFAEWSFEQRAFVLVGILSTPSSRLQKLIPIIQDVIGDREIDKELASALLIPPSDKQRYDHIESLLKKGASPNQVFCYSAHIDGFGYQFSNYKPDRYLVHRIVEFWEIPGLITLFKKYGADFSTQCVYGLNALEYFIADVCPSENLSSDRIKEVVLELYNAGLKPDIASGDSMSIYKGLEGSGKIFWCLEGVRLALIQKTPLWYAYTHNPRESYSGMSAEDIAYYQQIELPNFSDREVENTTDGQVFTTDIVYENQLLRHLLLPSKPKNQSSIFNLPAHAKEMGYSMLLFGAVGATLGYLFYLSMFMSISKDDLSNNKMDFEEELGCQAFEATAMGLAGGAIFGSLGHIAYKAIGFFAKKEETKTGLTQNQTSSL